VLLLVAMRRNNQRTKKRQRKRFEITAKQLAITPTFKA